MNIDRTYRIGDIYLMNFTGDNNEQRGYRPGIIFQNNIGNIHSPNVIALPLTSVIKKSGMPTHVIIPAKGTGLLKDSMVLCENPVCISKEKISSYITTVPRIYMNKIAKASLFATSCISFMSVEDLISTRREVMILNEA